MNTTSCGSCFSPTCRNAGMAAGRSGRAPALLPAAAEPPSLPRASPDSSAPPAAGLPPSAPGFRRRRFPPRRGLGPEGSGAAARGGRASAPPALCLLSRSRLPPGGGRGGGRARAGPPAAVLRGPGVTTRLGQPLLRNTNLPFSQARTQEYAASMLGSRFYNVTHLCHQCQSKTIKLMMV